MNFDWNDNLTCSFTNEEFTPDSLDRAKYAEYLTNYLKNYKNESYVFNINSPWGSGKTYFIKRWANTLAEKHPVIYFNSWKHDNNNEPLVLILSEIIKGLRILISGNTEKLNELQNKTVTVLKRVAPTLCKGVFQKLTGTSFDELVGNGQADEEESGDNKVGGELGAALAQALLDLHDEQAQAIESLKNEVELILEDVLTNDESERRKRRPMYVFIDELDRCRPTFAIELLEVIKHIFDIPKIIFVIATDTEQLQHSIKAVYGNDFAAEKYLMRFFNRSFSLPQPSQKEFLSNHRSFELISERLSSTSNLCLYEFTFDINVALVAYIFENLGIDLRTADQIIERVNSVLLNHESEKGVMLLIFLEALRVRKRTLFESLMNNKFGHQPTSDFHDITMDNSRKFDLVVSPRYMESAFFNGMSRNGRTREPRQALRTININTIAHECILIMSEREARLQSSSYSSFTSYLFESLNATDDYSLQRYKNYVEIASNLY
ncbi:KAP family P-loop NTPase fold protein [Pseudoalteromonas piratica]|uniref:KAP NTPase domain-containing protein n=1 Tax=Pseudoalteromonas piratica TaxID=1348114 RepID=A0A0A7EFJ6_9GAMM|nr:P-loop NTPase fold protein [Pseudoalteromonas piratica]AIY65389.1 hypothetical protein OM33_09675 [Pseudoalteromonas piratica]